MTTLHKIGPLTHSWVEMYASRYNPDGVLSPTLISVGHDADIVICPDIKHQTTVQALAWAAGYAVYPSDAIHVIALWQVHGVESHVSDLDVLGGLYPEVRQNPDAKPAVMAWGHEVPTSETVVEMMVRDVSDGGTELWEHVDYQGNVSDLDRLRVAVHDFDRYPLVENEHNLRRVARDEIRRDNGAGYRAQILRPGSIRAQVHQFRIRSPRK